ncbi:MAG: hypothetical protein DI562_02930 [Stenotrophomonas acidaminiphila]|uniref:DUF819 family protein n=1 Tax=Rhodovulum sulfidophilum TaxID=35806 RepID=A0A2W5MYF4_RHOSU|nr:DUF819 family protein [Pseudoxanthomonas sp.]PZQ32810.1 MAG: hypothetical protein DI562_02930 [Stenotrophomonas acidaminiphila]PZQ45398.1 MAG: hypothetical protein DI556_22790 [Rhodovulum sulfidophilum]
MAIEATEPSVALIQNDIVGLGLIAGTLAAVFYLSSGPTPFWKKFFSIVPALLLCYFIPALYNTFGVIDGQQTKLYNPVARDVLLPAALVLLTLSIDIKGILRLGPKLLAMFVTGTVGIMLGAIVSFQVMRFIHPQTVAGDTWAGMAALAGSWIGGGANMAAMRETFNVDATTFGQFAVVDIVCASIFLMPLLIWLAGRAERIDARNGADTAAIDDMKHRIADYEARNSRIPTLTDLMVIVGVGLGIVGAAHALAVPVAAWCGANISFARQASLDSTFVWVVMLCTFAGLALSFTRMRNLEAVGASKVGTLFLYFLIACIGMQMDLAALADRPWLLLLGLIWMLVHLGLLYVVGRLLKAPLFFLAIGSQGNVGAAASAPVVAAAFHPSLAPVGVLLGTVGYATGTVLAYITGLILKWMAGA